MRLVKASTGLRAISAAKWRLLPVRIRADRARRLRGVQS
jgi:hypothetical protein